MAISFKFSPRKFASAIALLAERKPGVTKKELCKLLFFADKKHLLRYGRPITGDQYCALEQGPIPSQGLDALNEKGNRANIEAVLKYGRLKGWTFELQGTPDLKVLSKSEISVLDETYRELGHLTAFQLEDLSHKEPAWIQADRNKPMDFLQFFDGHPEASLIRNILVEEHEGVAALSAG